MNISVRQTMTQNRPAAPSPDDREGPPAMSGADFDRALRSIGFTQRDFAQWSGIAERTVREHVRLGPKPSVVRLVQLMLAEYPAKEAKNSRLLK